MLVVPGHRFHPNVATTNLLGREFLALLESPEGTLLVALQLSLRPMWIFAVEIEHARGVPVDGPSFSSDCVHFVTDLWQRKGIYLAFRCTMGSL
jgi:hypothetical protein